MIADPHMGCDDETIIFTDVLTSFEKPGQDGKRRGVDNVVDRNLGY